MTSYFIRYVTENVRVYINPVHEPLDTDMYSILYTSFLVMFCHSGILGHFFVLSLFFILGIFVS
jgi:hypothetical protein